MKQIEPSARQRKKSKSPLRRPMRTMSKRAHRNWLRVAVLLKEYNMSTKQQEAANEPDKPEEMGADSSIELSPMEAVRPTTEPASPTEDSSTAVRKVSCRPDTQWDNAITVLGIGSATNSARAGMCVFYVLKSAWIKNIK